MGRHSAGSRAGVDPIVAAALSRRTTPVESAPTPAPAESQDGGLGWPGEPGEPSGLGWPDDTTATDATATDTTATDTPATDTPGIDTAVAALPVAAAIREGPPVRRRFGWRRWFGRNPALPPTPSGSSAA